MRRSSRCTSKVEPLGAVARFVELQHVMFAVNQHMANHSYPCYVFSRSAWGRRISPWFLTLVLAGYVLKFAVTYGLPPLF